MLGVASSHQENLLYFPAGWEGPKNGSDIPPLDNEGDSLDEEGGGTLLARLGHYPGPEFPDQVEAFLPPVATGLDSNWDEEGRRNRGRSSHAACSSPPPPPRHRRFLE